jgi:5-methylcytosine-specific restriction endonuclease McrA
MKKQTLKKLLKLKRKIFNVGDCHLSEIELKICGVVLSDHPLSIIEKMKQHRRFQVYHHKGTQCVSCGVVGVRIIKSARLPHSIHLDLYTRDLGLMTVDHILPKSKGGKMTLENLQPMCQTCNSIKGNTYEN